MATHPMAIARLLNDVRNSFITAINFDMEVKSDYNYTEDVQKAVGENINAIQQGLDNLIGLVAGIAPVQPQAPAQAPAEAPVEQPAEQSAPAQEMPAKAKTSKPRAKKPQAEAVPKEQ